MTYNKKRALSYGGILISVLLAYFCRQARPENVFMRNLADQCRNCIYLGMYCAWVIYLEKHVVHRKTRRCLTAIGCLMVFWFFVRTDDNITNPNTGNMVSVAPLAALSVLSAIALAGMVVPEAIKNKKSSK